MRGSGRRQKSTNLRPKTRRTRGIIILVNFVRWFFSPRSKDDWKSWNALFIAAPFAVGLVFVSSNLVRYHAIAGRQQSTTGVVTAYEPSNHNQCSYTFEIRTRQYTGKWSSPTQTASVGQEVRVYFDSSDPATNSLEDFESASQRQRGILSFLIFGICAVVGLIVYAKSRPTTASKRRTPA